MIHLYFARERQEQRQINSHETKRAERGLPSHTVKESSTRVFVAAAKSTRQIVNIWQSSELSYVNKLVCEEKIWNMLVWHHTQTRMKDDSISSLSSQVLCQTFPSVRAGALRLTKQHIKPRDAPIISTLLANIGFKINYRISASIPIFADKITNKIRGCCFLD